MGEALSVEILFSRLARLGCVFEFYSVMLSMFIY